MKLTQEQKIEIMKYICDVPRYRETCFELYDHIVNAFEMTDRSIFNHNEISKIVNEDFGGFLKIAELEAQNHQLLSKRYFKFFVQEVINTFKQPQGLVYLGLLFICCSTFATDLPATFNVKPMLLAVLILSLFILAFGYASVYYKERKYGRPSLLDGFIKKSSSVLLIFSSATIFLLLGKEPVLYLSDNFKLGIAWSLFLITSLYVKSYMKFYKRRIKLVIG